MRALSREPVRSKVAAVLIAACICSGAPGVLAATDKERAAARTIAKQGLDAYKAQQYDAAIDRFERAQALVHSPVHLLYLARSYAARGKLVKAHEMYLQAKRERLTPASPAAFVRAVEDAEKELQALKPRLAHLTVQVTGAEGAPVSMMVDGEAVPSVLIGVEMPVDPGERQIQVSAPGYFSATRTVALAEGESEQTTIELLPDPEAAAAASGAGEVEVDPLADVVPTRRRDYAGAGRNDGLLYGALGGFALAVGGGVFAYVNQQQRLELNAESDELYMSCPSGADGSRLCEEDEVAVIDEKDAAARSAGTRAVVGVVIGGVGLVAAGTLLGFWLNSGKERGVSNLQPWIGYRSIGLSGTF